MGVGMQSQPRCYPPTAPGTAGGGEGASPWEENSGPAVLGGKEGMMHSVGPRDRGVEPASLGESHWPAKAALLPAAGRLRVPGNPWGLPLR